MSSSNVPEEFKNATAVWNHDVERIINQVIAKNSSGTDEITNNNEFIHRALEYVNQTQPFSSALHADQAKKAVVAFNDEYMNSINNGQQPPHLPLDDRESTMLVTLKISDAIEAFNVIPSLETKFGDVPHELQRLIDEVNRYM